MPQRDFLKELLAYAGENKYTVTSSDKGRHNPGSKHYRRMAIDIGHQGVDRNKLFETAKQKGYRVLDETTRPKGQAVWGGPHYHIEALEGAQPQPMAQAQPKRSPVLSQLAKPGVWDNSMSQSPQMAQNMQPVRMPFGETSFNMDPISGKMNINDPRDMMALRPYDPASVPAQAAAPGQQGQMTIEHFLNMVRAEKAAERERVAQEYATPDSFQGKHPIIATLLESLAGAGIGALVGGGEGAAALGLAAPLAFNQREGNRKAYYANQRNKAMEQADGDDLFSGAASLASMYNTMTDANLKPQQVQSQVRLQDAQTKNFGATTQQTTLENQYIPLEKEAEIGHKQMLIAAIEADLDIAPLKKKELIAKINQTEAETGLMPKKFQLEQQGQQFDQAAKTRELGQKDRSLGFDEQNINLRGSELGLKQSEARNKSKQEKKLSGADAEKAYGLIAAYEEAVNGKPGEWWNGDGQAANPQRAQSIKIILSKMGINPEDYAKRGGASGNWKSNAGAKAAQELGL